MHTYLYLLNLRKLNKDLMKKTNFTFRIFEKSLTTLLILFSVIFSYNTANACELSCGGKHQMSLDENCQIEITPQMVLSDGGASCEGATFTVVVREYMNGPIIDQGATAIIGDDEDASLLIGKELVVEINANDNGTTNMCWGFIVLEDKLAPVIECEDITVSCINQANVLPTFLGQDCDPNPVINLIDQTEESLCDPLFLKRITRTYTATDKYGWTSQPCTQVIMVERFDTNTIVIPENLRLINNTALECDSGYATDSKGNPSPDVTGVPVNMVGDTLFPIGNFNCNLVVTYSDLVLPEVACVTKVMRTWTFSEWVCGEDNIFRRVQIIEIVDDEGPVITPIKDVSVSTTSGYSCQSLYLLPQVSAVDNCKEIDRIDIAYPGGFVNDYDGSEIITLPVGANDITVTAYDGCLNSSIETFTVTVQDNTAPVAVCDQNTVVALSSDGYTDVNAFTFDDGSYDECGIDRMEVKRMDNGSACGEDWDEFGDYVTFCCDDIGNNPIVILRVYDLAGNYNECMVNVEVQDKLAPTITCPDDMTVDCDFSFVDTEQGLIDAFGDATFKDNCSGTTMTRTVFYEIDQCNEGRIIRNFVARDANGAQSCQQIITFVNNEPFNGAEDIEWPDDVTITDCLDLSMGMRTEELAAVSPDATGRPILSEDACDMVGADYDDRVFEVFNASQTSCFKIIRTWTVLDWCQRYENGTYYEWTWDQVIMVNNAVAPTFSFTCEDITKCTYDGECNDGEVILLASATDDCTPDEALAWQFSLDMDNDGDFDSISPILYGGQISATNDYPIGTHRIVWTVEDRCGNSTSCEQLFTIENCKTPTPYCYNGLAISLMGVDENEDGIAESGMIDIWASDFDAGSFHGCGYDVTVSFSSNPLDTGRTFTCADIGRNEVDIWASATLEDGTLVQDFCTTYVDIQDNQGVCDGSGTGNLVAVGGQVSTENNIMVDEVKVFLDRSEQSFRMTDGNGIYAFTPMPTGGSYAVVPEKDVDHMNGVTTLDLVLIQRHILGLKKLSSPYKMIASDINRDGTITAADLLQLRKSILGLADGFPDNTSWRFIDKGYNFLDVNNPLSDQFNEIYNINQLNSDMDIDFVAVKVGDVNESVIANANMLATVRENPNSLVFAINESDLQAGNQYSIPVYANNFNEIIAYQHSINLSDKVELVSIQAGNLEIDDSNFGLQAVNQGVITTSWDALNPTTKDQDEVLYTINVVAKQNTKVSEVISFTSAITTAEAYTEGMNLDVQLTVRNNPSEVNGFVLYQNTPNPFTGVTNIAFDLPENTNATFSVYDVTGKKVYGYTQTFNKGRNIIELNAETLNTSGVLYYTLQTETFTATRKMVVVK